MASPIETALHGALREFIHAHLFLRDHVAAGRCVVVKVDGGWRVEAGSLRPVEDLGDGAWCVRLFSQVKALSYKLDFALDLGRAGILAVECDGHEWHERTKQQAAHDRSRDRELLRVGIPTIRFTGSEIHHDAARCAVEVYGVACSMVEDFLIRDSEKNQSYEEGVAASEKRPGPDGRDLDQFNEGFTAGIEHFAKAFDGDDSFTEEHW